MDRSRNYYSKRCQTSQCWEAVESKVTRHQFSLREEAYLKVICGVFEMNLLILGSDRRICKSLSKIFLTSWCRSEKGVINLTISVWADLVLLETRSWSREEPIALLKTFLNTFLLYPLLIRRFINSLACWQNLSLMEQMCLSLRYCPTGMDLTNDVGWKFCVV